VPDYASVLVKVFAIFGVINRVPATTPAHIFRYSAVAHRGGARHFHFGGPLEGPVLQQGELSMVCVGLSKKDLKNFGGATGGARQNFWGAVAPLAPPSSAPGCAYLNSLSKFGFQA